MNKKEKTKLIPKLRFPGFLDEWKSIPFGKAFDFQQTNTFSRNLMNTQKGKVRNIHYGDVLIKYGYVLRDVSSVPFVNEDVALKKYSKNSYLQSGDVVIADTAEDLSAGKAVEVQNINCDILSGLHTMLCRPIDQAAPGFWGYYINSPAYHNTIIPLITGVKVSSISKSNIIKTFVASTNTTEQQKIADCLSSLDDLIAAEEKKLETLRLHKKGLMQKLFPAEGKAVPQVRFGGFTDPWKVRSLGDIGVATSGTSIESEFVSHGKYKVISIGSYSENSIYNDQNIRANMTSKTQSRILNKGDLTMVLNDKTSSGNIIGRVLLIGENDAYIYNQRTQRIEPYHDEYDSNFLYQLLNAHSVRAKIIKQAQGNTQIYVNWSVIRELTYRIPCKPEQVLIGDFLSNFDDQITAQAVKIRNLKLHKKGLMQGLFPSIEEVRK